MTTIFVIQNQHGHYLGKQQQWLDGRDRRLLFRTAHRDEAVNVIFEQSSKDIYLRAQPLECELDDSKQPIVKAGPPIADENTELSYEAGTATETAEPADAEQLNLGEDDISAQ
ncbi:hypothetical protein AB4876_11255 [Zhongshania guokunii]|uniref:Uncharacterized protein n=1 Tax=Zhongshania guokunii TaxID=641783 RepID=A0ABV3U936_9GAMM